MQYLNEVEKEIEIGELLKFLFKKIKVIILVGMLITIAIAGYKCATYSVVVLEETKIYEASTRIYIENQDPEASPQAVTNDIYTTMTSNNVIEAVIDELDLDMDYNQIVNKITVNTDSTDTVTPGYEFYKISFVYVDKELAVEIIDLLTEKGIEKLQEVKQTENIKIVDDGYAVEALTPTEIASLQTGNNVSVDATNTATPVVTTVTPSYVIKNTVLGGIIGFSLVLIYYVCYFLFYPRIKSAKEAEYTFKAPVIGTITSAVGNSDFKESVNAIRANIGFASSCDLKLLSVVPSTKSKSKIVIAEELGKIYSKNGKNVLIIHADYKDNSSKEAGFSDLLSGKASLEKVIRKQAETSLDIISAGNALESETDLIGRPSFFELLEEVKQKYDIVIFATPVADKYMEGIEISHHCDSTVISLEPDTLSLKAANEIKKKLELSECNLVGIIVNQKIK